MHEVIQLQAEIAGAVAQRAKLAEALSAADQHIRDLTRRLEQLNGAARSESTLVPTSSAAKVSLFRKLFRGRADVWPRLWHSTKTGKKGYSPVCGNEWRDGICIKPAKKCSACPHQAWLPLTETVIQDHLQGRHTAGVYAMLPDETCAFLAADFDEASWQADVMAYCRAGLAKGIDVAVERSRSGKGAHAWVFFEQPVPAATARKLGFLLLTAASAAHPELSLQSYDRLFPSQDLMPKGGFGNLIALPLQHGPRQTGNSVFVDTELQPYSDQWAFLAGIRRLGLDELANLVMAAERDNAILGLPNWPEEERDQPWQRPPSGAKPKPIPGPLPAVVHAVLAQRCFVPIAGLPPQLVDRMRRLAAFSNPAFHQKQAMRLPVAHIPRIIACGQLDGEFLSLPRGMVEPVRELLMGLGVKLQVCDERQPGTAVTATFKGSLLPWHAARPTARGSPTDGIPGRVAAARGQYSGGLRRHGPRPWPQLAYRTGYPCSSRRTAPGHRADQPRRTARLARRTPPPTRRRGGGDARKARRQTAEGCHASVALNRRASGARVGGDG